MLPYYLGCPSWSEAGWRGRLYPDGTPASDYLALYAQVFNAVEGNTTFYARPSVAIVQRWAQRMPAHFRFCAKLPRDISHSAELRLQMPAAQAFVESLAPLGERVTPFWLQLPASFGPARLGELADFLAGFERPLAVEVRHPAFFQRGEEERALNRLLRDRDVERLCLDSRPLFSCCEDTPAVRHAQSRKPRLPVRPAALTAFPQVRFIGHPLLAANDPFMTPWLDKVAAWIEEGRQPYVFLHTPDNLLAPELARRFHERLRERLPGLPPLPAAADDSQLDLL
ncbi:DUF72 domain-containing protein [Azorhizophilus paspali]|uniref:DUF72 domain-containing protein n=1 Tax=Azorhizophilus paspali TaxID=69963 RepID=A0ABV6SPT5_AZOPA